MTVALLVGLCGRGGAFSGVLMSAKLFLVRASQSQHPPLNDSYGGSMTPAEQNRLIVEYMDLATLVAHSYRSGKIPLDELIAFGREGLVRAARSFHDRRENFGAYARVSIDNAIRRNIAAWGGQVPEDEAPITVQDADKIERIYEWDVWGGDRGQAAAIAEGWLTLDTTPEEMAIAFEDIADKRHRFAAAFISLTAVQRALVRLVYLSTPAMSILGASQEIGISYRRSLRALRKAIRTMREVIGRMETNKGTSRGASHVRRADLASRTPARVKLQVVRDS